MIIRDSTNDKNNMIARIIANDYNDSNSESDGNRNRMTTTMTVQNDDKTHHNDTHDTNDTEVICSTPI